LGTGDSTVATFSIGDFTEISFAGVLTVGTAGGVRGSRVGVTRGDWRSRRVLEFSKVGGQVGFEAMGGSFLKMLKMLIRETP
jgi:hypothetical protein